MRWWGRPQGKRSHPPSGAEEAAEELACQGEGCPNSVPQGLKPTHSIGLIGATEVAFHGHFEFFPQAVKPRLFTEHMQTH